jgi:hypothetical protein
MGKQIASEVLSAADQALLDKINAAVTTANAAEHAAETAKAELVSRLRAVGELLLEAKERHPKVADFEAFLKRVDGLKLSRAYDAMRLAGGRTTDEQLRQEARDRQRKSRAKKAKLPPPIRPTKAEPEPKPISVTEPHVTESSEIGAEERTRPDGLLYSDPRRLDDPGIAVYFTFKKKKLVMARDGFVSVAGNLRSLALAIEGMRQMHRHGGDLMLERAFTGFLAIALPDWKKPWREVFGIKADWTGDINELYRQKARLRHPDAGGNDTLMAELNVAYQEAKLELTNGGSSP